MTANDFERLLPELKTRLRALVSQSKNSAPTRVEAALLAEFRRRRRVRPRWARTWYWAGAAAACLLMAAGLIRWDRRPAPAPKTSAASSIPAVAESRRIPEVRRAPVPAAARVSKAVRRAPKVVRAASRAPESGPSEIATEFIPVSFAAAPAEQPSVVRVRLPRSALLSFGLPMNVDRAAEPVLADVVVGEDGVARAIRFVR